MQTNTHSAHRLSQQALVERFESEQVSAAEY